MVKKRPSVMFLVSLSLAATLPVKASAEQPPSDEQVGLSVTATIDGGHVGCVGYSTLSLSVLDLVAEEHSYLAAESDPNAFSTLAALSGWSADDIRQTQIQHQTELGQTLDSLFIETPEGLQINSVFQNWFVHPLIDAFNAADITGDGNLNQNDPSPLQFAKRSLRTPEFTVDFDADSCTESTRLGLLTASRSELEARETDVQDVESSQWQVIEGDLSYGIMQENQFNLAGRSYLVSNTGALGSLELPLCNEIGPECLPDWIYEYLWRPEELVGVGDPMGSSNPDWLTLDHAASVGLTAWIKTHGNQTGYDLRTMYFFELQRMPESMDLLEVLSYLD